MPLGANYNAMVSSILSTKGNELDLKYIVENNGKFVFLTTRTINNENIEKFLRSFYDFVYLYTGSRNPNIEILELPDENNIAIITNFLRENLISIVKDYKKVILNITPSTKGIICSCLLVLLELESELELVYVASKVRDKQGRSLSVETSYRYRP